MEKIAASLLFPKFSITWRAEVQDQKLQIMVRLYALVWFYAFLAPLFRAAAFAWNDIHTEYELKQDLR